jgi:hypothetical protein
VAISGIGAQPPASPSLSTTSGSHKHHGHKVMSISDADGQSSGISAPSSGASKIGSKVDVKV